MQRLRRGHSLDKNKRNRVYLTFQRPPGRLKFPAEKILAETLRLERPVGNDLPVLMRQVEITRKKGEKEKMSAMSKILEHEVTFDDLGLLYDVKKDMYYSLAGKKG